ncbi:F0F1 ATP synthase subunit epsilon [Rhodobaculum claviforme]|uniref:ATP synthase epsilon chain n=1 Tax=Rhodobaculum claviforme TaxID=1549854 RepID=A0A934TIV5_9RHOB|nr:F0F1 ATP synthase subunit epsilon [Rhodobaculum claviforme]MBK5926590.1 ATP synthase F1 subunit epsilon [Rhodobaculum claviforme]
MADTFDFELVSPERRLASMSARAVQIPGADGDLTAMPDHAPTITTLRPGVLRVEGPDGAKAYVVTGGFAEITPGAASVLAERAMPLEEATAEVVDALIAEARQAAADAPEDTRAEADKLVADMEALRGVANA